MALLTNKVAIITGASSGIGRAATKLFAQEGASLVIGARREDELNQLAEEVKSTGGKISVLAGDVTSEDYNKHLVDLALADFGRLDVAFNNAGTLGTLVPVTELTRSDWDFAINTNLTSGYLAAKHQIPAMLTNNGGSIIFTSSVIGNTVGMPMKSAYAAGKAGLVGLAQTLASEYGSQGIRVNALVPGAAATPMADLLGTDPETVAFIESLHVLKRRATPQEIASAALFLASDLASFTTGSALRVDGGVSICKT